MDSSDATKVLPLWQRLLFAALPANLVVYTCLVVVGLSFPDLLRDIPEGRNSGPGELYVAVGVIYFTILTLVAVMALSITVCTVIAGFVRWKRWYTAVAGGVAAAVIGIKVGALALWAIASLI
jgi:hypothetical protein